MILLITISAIVDFSIFVSMYNWDFYENLSDYHPIADANNLYDGFQKARKGSHWKSEVQRFRWDWSTAIGDLQDELTAYQNGDDNAYKLQEYSKFEVDERGIIRPITALRIRDRVVKHVLNDLYLLPHIKNKLIYDNGASLKGKGVSFTRKRLIAHLESYFRENGTNEGYIRLSDFSGYYDNINHELAMKMICKYEPDEFARKLVWQAFESYNIDVSFMTDAEYEKAKLEKFRLVDYRNEGHKFENRGLKYLHKSLSVGDQTSQITAIAFPNGIDKLITIVCGQKYYARYMDDTYLICRTKEEARRIGDIFSKAAKRYKMFVNEKKTQIYKLNKTFVFMKYRYYLNEKGHVVVRICKNSVTKMRRKLKRLSHMVYAGKKSITKVEEVFRSWICGYRNVMSKLQVNNMVDLYRNLFGGGLDTWLIKKHLL